MKCLGYFVKHVCQNSGIQLIWVKIKYWQVVLQFWSPLYFIIGIVYSKTKMVHALHFPTFSYIFLGYFKCWIQNWSYFIMNAFFVKKRAQQQKKTWHSVKCQTCLLKGLRSCQPALSLLLQCLLYGSVFTCMHWRMSPSLCMFFTFILYSATVLEVSPSLNILFQSVSILSYCISKPSPSHQRVPEPWEVHWLSSSAISQCPQTQIHRPNPFNHTHTITRF